MLHGWPCWKARREMAHEMPVPVTRLLAIFANVIGYVSNLLIIVRDAIFREVLPFRETPRQLVYSWSSRSLVSG